MKSNSNKNIIKITRLAFHVDLEDLEHVETGLRKDRKGKVQSHELYPVYNAFQFSSWTCDITLDVCAYKT